MHTSGHKILDLTSCIVDASLELGRLIITGCLKGPGKGLGQPGLAETGDPADLGVVGHWHDARHDGGCDPFRHTLLAK